MNSFRSLFRYLIDSNIFVAVAAVALTLETLVMQGLPMNAIPLLCLIFFSTLFIYTVSRLQLLPQRSFAASLKNFPGKVMSCLSLGAILIAVSKVSHSVLFLIAPIALLSVGYALPLFRSRTQSFTLREVPMLKIFIISLVWGITTVCIPLLDKGASVFNMDVLLILLRRMLYIFAITVPFDIRDEVEDAKNRLKTLPGTFGVRGSKIIAAAALLLFIILLFVNNCPTKQSILAAYIVPLMFSSFVAGVFIYKTTPSRSKYYYLFFLDGTMILQFLLVYFWRFGIIR